MEQFFNNIIIGFHFFPGRSFLDIYFGCHTAEEGGREESMGGFWSMSSGHSRSPCFSFVQRRYGEARESRAGCCPLPLRSRSPEMGQQKRRSALRVPSSLRLRATFWAPAVPLHTLRWASWLASGGQDLRWPCVCGGWRRNIHWWCKPGRGSRGWYRPKPLQSSSSSLLGDAKSGVCPEDAAFAFLHCGKVQFLQERAHFADRLKHLAVYLFSASFFLRNWWLTRLCHGVSLVPREMDCWAESGWAGQRAMQMVFMFQTCHVKGF